MPLHHDTPRPSVKRTLLYHGEKKLTKQHSAELLRFLLLRIHRERQLARLLPSEFAALRKRRLRRELVVILQLRGLDAKLLNIPYLRSRSMGPIKGPDDFDHLQFHEQFRFRKRHFFRILNALVEEDGEPLAIDNIPRTLKFGRAWHKTSVRSDKALMVFLRRMAAPCRWCDLQLILGGSQTVLSDTFNYMTRILYDRYSPLVSSIKIWQDDFATFAAQLRKFGCPFPNLVMFIDRHFQPTCRPGGDGCKNLNLKDFQTYASKERLHGLKYQGAVLPNGMALLWGPWRGTEHDATMLREAGILEELRQICEAHGIDYCGFGDSAYPLHRFLQRVLKPVPGGELTQLEHRFTALMARYRIVVENIFGEATNYFGILTHRHNMRLGLMQVGKIFPLAMLFYNLRLMFYCNQTSAYFESESMLLELSVEGYLAKAL